MHRTFAGMLLRGSLSCAIVTALVVASQSGCDPSLSGFTSGGPADTADAAEGADGGGADGSTTKSDARSDDDAATDGSTASCDTSGGARQNGYSCNDSSECCSGACSESHKCVAACVADNASGCDPQSSSCCAGDYCSTTAGTKCKPCIATGNTPELTGSGYNSKSCCTRSMQGAFDGGTPKCVTD